ncbi:MAG: hypothetical protein DIU75_016355, partial [Mycolicibacterium hassiacum]
MANTRNCLAITVIAGAGLFWPAVIAAGFAGAEPSPGVPCLDMVQNLAASPPSIPETIDTAASALGDAAPTMAEVPPPPVEELVAAVSAAAAPAPAEAAPVVPPAGEFVPAAPGPAEAVAAAAPLVEAAAPLPAPPPAAIPPG